LVEFALLAPIMIMILMSIAAYGGYFYMAHTVQEVANDAARAAIGGLTASERQSLASQAVTLDLQNYGFMAPSDTTVQVGVDNGQDLTVFVNYNAAAQMPYALQAWVPLPPSTITRGATIALGGY
jgi:Flp pilus assembly protein TadG